MGESRTTKQKGRRRQLQRVSRACDQCRATRRRCDGRDPECGSCNLLSRPCTYGDSPRKRGVSAGYLPALEAALAWLIERKPENQDILRELISEPCLAEDYGLAERWKKSETRDLVVASLGALDLKPPRAQRTAKAIQRTATSSSTTSIGSPESSTRETPISYLDHGGGGGCQETTWREQTCAVLASFGLPADVDFMSLMDPEPSMQWESFRL